VFGTCVVHKRVVVVLVPFILINSPGKMWLFCGSLANFLYENSHEFIKGSALANATYGNAIITDGGGAPGTPKYETFLEEWRKLGDDPDTLAYINSKQPASNGGLFDFNRTKEWFHKPPNDVAIYSYEAIIGIGISACKAAVDDSSDFQDGDVFSGEEHHAAFRNIDFVSASGRVTIGPDNFSRNDLSTYYIVGNLLPLNSTKTTVTMQGKKYSYYDALNTRWNIYRGSGENQQFIFSDGTTIAPPQLGQIEENMNLISGGVRAFCLVLATIIILLSVCFLSCTVAMRKKTVFRMSQPPFLIMICIGTFLMATGIICLSMDEGVATITGLNASCTLMPWLLSIGFVVTFAALFSKLWRINKLVKASRGFRRVTITIFDVLVPFLILLSMNTIILIIWQSISPLRWEREALKTNQYDQVIASEGSCNSKNSTVYISALLVVNGIAIILACHQAYIGRNVRTEMNESKQLGMAMICIFQSCFFGIPLLFMTSSNRSAYLFISSSVYFVVCVSTLLCIFLPKFFKLRGIRLGTAENSRGASVTGISNRARRLRSNMDTIDFESLTFPRDNQDANMGERLKTLRASQKDAKQKKQSTPNKEEQALNPVKEENIEPEGEPSNCSVINVIINSERSTDEIEEGQIVNDGEAQTQDMNDL
jgi:7 transmembrane sweet-taste receptor of 3 GCPR.